MRDGPAILRSRQRTPSFRRPRLRSDRKKQEHACFTSYRKSGPTRWPQTPASKLRRFRARRAIVFEGILQVGRRLKRAIIMSSRTTPHQEIASSDQHQLQCVEHSCGDERHVHLLHRSVDSRSGRCFASSMHKVTGDGRRDRKAQDAQCNGVRDSPSHHVDRRSAGQLGRRHRTSLTTEVAPGQRRSAQSCRRC